jgi:glycosyltransferase involved in cell wall biosynthesis
MIYKYDLAIITPTNNPEHLHRLLNQVDNQRYDGIRIQLIIVQEAHDFNSFNITSQHPIGDISVLRQTINNDGGAAARDRAILAANAEYISFWDDDNLYHPHAAVSQYLTAKSYDIGIVRTRHLNFIIPTSNIIEPGYIDTMCICIRKEFGIKEKWADGLGRYSDYRYITKLMKHPHSINYSKIIIGHHL